jgi:hypothetical protein
MGLSLPLDQFSFSFGATGQGRLDGIQVEFDARLGDDANTWSFGLYQASPNHLLAFAYRGASAAPLVRDRQIVPLWYESEAADGKVA